LDHSGPQKGWRHPKDLGVAEVRAFLTHLAAERKVSASTQNQALNALLFLYRHVLDRGMEFVEGFERAHRSRRVIYYEAYLEEQDAPGREQYLKSGGGRRFLKNQLRHYLTKHPLRSGA
jgi:hypothetical protein